MTNVFVENPDSLVTTHEAYRAGVLEIALFKNKESIPYLEKAKALYVRLRQETKCCEDLSKLGDLHETLLEAAGITQKTKKHLSAEDKRELLTKFVYEVLKKTGKKYVDEVVYRYLMALGEQLGGHMRNCIGNLARGKLMGCLVGQLQISDILFRFFLEGDKAWKSSSSYKPEYAESIKGIEWSDSGHARTLLNNVNVAGLSKNVDIVLLAAKLPTISSTITKEALVDPKNIIMMGELKGGIDPAGGDEHWKTARGALERIRKTYKRADILFVCASIEKAMAKEIYSMLQMGDLNCVANLTDINQLSAACSWIVKL